MTFKPCDQKRNEKKKSKVKLTFDGDGADDEENQWNDKVDDTIDEE